MTAWSYYHRVSILRYSDRRVTEAGGDYILYIVYVDVEESVGACRLRLHRAK